MATSTALTHYAETQVINAVFRGQAVTFPAAWYLALFLTDPTDSGTAGTEVSGGSYARQPIAFSVPGVSGTGSQTSNTAQVSFPAATTTEGTAYFFGLYDAVTAGNMWVHGALASPAIIGPGVVVQLPVSSLPLTVD